MDGVQSLSFRGEVCDLKPHHAQKCAVGFLARPTGIEPVSQEPESCVLSVILRAVLYINYLYDSLTNAGRSVMSWNTV